MRALIQRVNNARVTVDGDIVGDIGRGMLIFLGVMQQDTIRDMERLAGRCLKLRCFTDENDKMNLNVSQINGSILVVSQFTLCADTASGHRPSFSPAAHPDLANELYEKFVDQLRQSGIRVETGIFAADMKVDLSNDGPVTFLLEESGK